MSTEQEQIAMDTKETKITINFQHIGLILSTICVIIQVIWLAIEKQIRRRDQKILLQLSIAKLMFVYTCMADRYILNYAGWIVYHFLYMELQTVTPAWMFFFAYNLHGKLVNVFVQKKYSFVKLSILIWIVPMPFAISYCLLIKYRVINDFYVEITFFLTMFPLLIANTCFLIVIFVKTIKRNKNQNNLQIVKVSLVLLVLLLTVGVQELFLLPFVYMTSVPFIYLNIILIVSQTYYVITTTIIFVIISKNSK